MKQKFFYPNQHKEFWKKIILYTAAAWMWILHLLYYADSIAKNFSRISESFKMILKTFFWS